MRKEINIFILTKGIFSDGASSGFFDKLFKSVQCDCELIYFQTTNEIEEYLESGILIPDLIFLDRHELDVVHKLKRRALGAKAIYAVFIEQTDTIPVEAIFEKGVNVCVEKKMNAEELSKTLTLLLNLCWQYIMDGLDKEIFLLNLSC